VRLEIEPTQGEVWDVNFDPQVGREQAGFRPALVISSNSYNRTDNGLFIVVPITSIDRGIRLHLKIEPPEGGLTKPSVVMCDQICAQSEERFYRRRGAVSAEVMSRVLEIARLVILD
jgi:mRNA interferase MazF